MIPYILFLLVGQFSPNMIALGGGLSILVSVFVGYFIGFNFYLVGLYLDHAFKIYYHLNSSLDRVVYRLLFGGATISLLVLFFKMTGGERYITLASYSVVAFNLLLSVYPTTAKIIYSSTSKNFSELKHLDKLERFILSMFATYFMFSTPNLIFLSKETISSFLTFDIFHQNYIFSTSIFSALDVATNSLGYFYFLFGGLYYLIIYSFFRFFFSRRVSLIGILALVTNWNLTKMVYGDFTTYATAMYLLSFLWAHIWVGNSKSYRTNLFFGLILCLGSHHPYQISGALLILGLLSTFVTTGVVTPWARLQSLKYMSLGVIIALGLITNDFFGGGDFVFQKSAIFNFNLFFKKAFNILSLMGVIIFLTFYLAMIREKLKKPLSFLNSANYLFFSLCFIVLVILLSGYGQHFSLSGFIYFAIILFCLPTLELVLNSFGIFHPRRNLIFFLYILFVILDSHLESRVKTFIDIIIS